jgi:predicted TIM-barrel fold metal-dependent hydrolase
VDRAVIVPPSWIGETNAYALEASATYPTRFAVMGRFDSEDPAFLAQLPTWLDQPHMLGIRITFNTPHFVAGLDEGIFDPLFAGCDRYHIPLMALFSGPLLAKVPPIVEKYPGLPLIIDHMGALTRVQGPASFASNDLLLALAKYPNVYVKTTSAPSNSAEAFPYKDVHPFLKSMYDAFGARRLMWGSDITRLKGSYGECLSLFREELDFLTAEDKTWILGRTLAEALNWPE